MAFKSTLKILMAKMNDRLGNVESKECKITVHVDSDWICENEIEGYSLLNAADGTVVPGYAHMTGARVIDLANVDLSMRQIKDKDAMEQKLYASRQHNCSKTIFSEIDVISFCRQCA